MEKKILDVRQKKYLEEFLEKNVRAIIDAEIQTYKDTPYSSHAPRVYIFTTYTMGIIGVSDLNEQNDIQNTLMEIIQEYKCNEDFRLRDDPEIYEKYRLGDGSHVTALLCFIPSTTININFNELEKLPIELREKAKNKTINPSDLVGEDGIFKEEYKYLIGDVITMHYSSFYTQKGYIYRVIHHNDEVLDMPLQVAFGQGSEGHIEGNPDVLGLNNLIEIE